MLFNSLVFAVFLTIVFSFYWLFSKDLKIQNGFLLLASWFFYGWWDWRFLILLMVLSFINYLLGIKIDKNNQGLKRSWLIAGLIINIGALGIFKYFNFFIDSFISLFSLFGYDLPRSVTKILLPLGISFYTFLSLSYLLDISKGIIKANRNILEVLLSLGFFPIILAGPIQRPSSLLPQIARERTFNYERTTDGLRQILWGLFTKVVIADNLAFYVDDIFLNQHDYHASALLLGALFYTVQIYADFSGYSNIAIGIGKLLGFNLMQNFAYPYFAKDINDFWKRWHISLTTWFRDYLFLPVSFSVSWRLKGERTFHIKTNLFIYITASAFTWFLTGLWHGANYTFIIWGMIHGLLLIFHRAQAPYRKKLFKRLKINSKNFLVTATEAVLTSVCVIIAWVFFRSDSVTGALTYISSIFSGSLFYIPVFSYSRMVMLFIIFLVVIFFIVEWKGRNKKYPIESVGRKIHPVLRWSFYYIFIIVIFFFAGSGQKFIYFQF